MAIVSELAKKIEPVGEAYAKLQGKFLRNQQRNDIKSGTWEYTDKGGKKLVVEDSEQSGESDEEEESEEEKEEGDGDHGDT